MSDKIIIWIVNFHTAPPHLTSQPRYVKMIPQLRAAGYDVIIVGQSYLRNYKKSLISGNKKFVEKEYDGIKYIHVKSLAHSGNGIKRMLAYFIFSCRLFSISRKVEQPDIIIHNLHVPFDVPVYFLARKLKATYIAEVWDLWPEFFHRMGLVKRNNPFITLAYKIEKWIYLKADKIIYTMEGWPDYIKGKKWDIENGGKIDLSKSLHLTNGLDVNEFLANANQYQLDDADLHEPTSFKVLYLGSLRKANNLKQLLDAAMLLKSEKDIKFFIYGDGEERSMLERYAMVNKMENVIFKAKHISFRNVPFVLTKSSLNILNYQQGFGDFGVSSGKLPLYLACGKPILTNVQVAHCIIKKNRLGISEMINSPEQYATRILQIKNLENLEYNAICKRVLDSSKEFDYKVLTNRLIVLLKQINSI